MQTKWLKTSIQRFKHRTWWFEPSQLDHLWKSKTNTTNIQSNSINVISDNTLCTDNADVLPTWFPDAGFSEKLTKLSFLKLSERQEGTHLYIKLLIHLFMQGQKYEANIDKRHKAQYKDNPETQNTNNMNNKRTLWQFSDRNLLILS